MGGAKMNFLKSLEISFSGLSAQRQRMDVISQNLANIETTRTSTGGPYRRKMVMMSPGQNDLNFSDTLDNALNGVKIDDVVEDPTPFNREYAPSHPDADKDGYVLKPNVNLYVENANMVMTQRSYEANIAAVKSIREMTLKALEIGK